MNMVNKWRVTLLLIGMLYAGTLHAAECEHSIINEWGTGFTSSLSITNNTSEVINDWALTLQFPDGSTINNLWNGNLSGSNPYDITNASYNGTIQPNASVSFGFNGVKGVSGEAVEAVVLGGICSGTPTPTPTPTNQAPVAQASASPATGTVPFDVTFNGSQSSDPDGDAITYLWNFGDGTTSSDASPTHSYTQQGSYSVSLIVNDGSLNSPAASLTIDANGVVDPTVAYALDSGKSSLHFVSTKKTHVMEVHEFTSLSGSIANDGSAVLNVSLTSVETGIDLRNDRLRSLLFEVDTFSQATVTLSVDMSALATMTNGETEVRDITATLNLHGIDLDISTQVNVTKLSSGVLVESITPILINTNDYGLTIGVDALKDAASLDHISYTTPINFTLFFNAP